MRGIGFATMISAPLAFTPVASQAMDMSVPLRAEQAAGLVGSPVLSADDVPIGRLVAFRPQDDGTLFCVVMLHQSLQVATSALMVEGLLHGADGTLRVPDDAATLVSRMKLPLSVTD